MKKVSDAEKAVRKYELEKLNLAQSTKQQTI